MTPRRKFLQHSAAIATALQTHQANAIQSKSTIPMALIGRGGQGTNLMLNFAKIPRVETSTFVIQTQNNPLQPPQNSSKPAINPQNCQRP